MAMFNLILSKIYSCQRRQRKLHKSGVERSLHRRISQKWSWHKVCTPLLTHGWETYMALQENIYGRQRECIWNIYGTQATVNSRTRDGSLDSPPWWGNCDDRCGDNNAPVLIIGGADWRLKKRKKRPKKGDFRIRYQNCPTPKMEVWAL